MNTRDYAIYIAGMDNNVDLIRCAVKCMRQSTKIDCRFYVGVEQATTNEKDVIEVCCQPGKQWSSRVREHLKQIQEDKIILLLEDYFVSGLDQNAVVEIVELMDRYSAGVVKLYSEPKPDHGMAGMPNLGMFLPGKKIGRVNTQPAIWKKSFLSDLLFGDESLWEFEINAAVRSDAIPSNVLGVYSNLIEYDEVVKRGKYRNRYKKKYAKIIEPEGTKTARGYLTYKAEIFFEIEDLFSKILRLFLSQHLRTKLRNMVFGK